MPFPQMGAYALDIPAMGNYLYRGFQKSSAELLRTKSRNSLKSREKGAPGKNRELDVQAEEFRGRPAAVLPAAGHMPRATGPGRISESEFTHNFGLDFLK